MITEAQVEQIREATNIVDLVGGHVRLKKRGRNYTGLCPFHGEKTPSFSVLEDKGIFKCFGCGKGGDVFSFVMMMEGLTFPEAIERLAKRAGIEIENTPSDEELRARDKRESVYDALRAAATWYFRTLRSPAGNAAMEYLVRRGLESETIHKFGLGYAPDRAGLLVKALTDQGYQLETLEEAGLVARRDGAPAGDVYERFRGRVIFPVLNSTGRIVGFGGRILPQRTSDIPGSAKPKEGSGRQMAKYINSPDTAVYHKSKILYGLYLAKDAIRRKEYAILVEGYADVLAVNQAGVENVVAASGTSLTADQLALLKRYTTTIVLLFDADAAGQNAAMRGIELAIEAGFNVETVVLPAGEDPDSYIRAKGRDAFEAALEQRQSWIETKAQWFEEHGAFKDPARAATAIRSIVETIAKVPDAIKRSLFIQRLGERFHLSEQMLTIELQNHIQSEAARPKPRSAPARKAAADDRPSTGMQSAAAYGEHDHRATGDRPFLADLSEGPPAGWEQVYADRDEPASPPVVTISRAEQTLLESMLADPAGVAHVIDETGFDITEIEHPHVQEIISYVQQRVLDSDVPTLEQLCDVYREEPTHLKLIVDHGTVGFDLSAQWDEGPVSMQSIAAQQARDAIAALDAARMSQELAAIRAKLKLAVSPEEERSLMAQLTELARKKHGVVDRAED